MTQSSMGILPVRATCELGKGGTPGLPARRWALTLFLLVLSLLPSVSHAAFEVSGELLGSENDCPVSFLRVEIRNRTGEKTRCEMKLSGGYGRMGGEVSIASLDIEPDGERTVDLAIPMMNYPTLHVHANGRRVLQASVSRSQRGLPFLNIAEMGKWGSEKELDEFSKEWSDPGGYHGRHPSGTGPSYRVVTQLEPHRLPENWLCYAPYRGVFCRESSYDRLSAGAKTALMKWVDSGGHLVIYGSENDETIKQMAGTIVYQSRNPLTLASREMFGEWRRTRPVWQGNNQWQHATGSSAEDKTFPFGVKEVGGKGGALGLTTAFLVLAGPVNYFYFRRRGQLRRLMISLPAISLGFCVLIMGYFIATQGFTRKGGSFAVSLLDESRGAALTFTRHSVFSGLYPLGGFKFDSETGFVPLRAATDFSIRLGAITHLESGIFQPTSNFHYQTLKPHTTREKLIYKAEDQSVVNGFEKPIELVLVSDGGNWYVARGVVPGAKARLERLPVERVTAAAVPESEKMMHLFAGELTRWDSTERDFLLGQMSAYLRSPAPEGMRYLISFDEGDLAAMQPGLRMDNPGMRHVIMNVATKSDKVPLVPTGLVLPAEGDVGDPLPI